jgi:hypothetical protein
MGRKKKPHQKKDQQEEPKQAVKQAEVKKKLLHLKKHQQLNYGRLRYIFQKVLL